MYIYIVAILWNVTHVHHRIVTRYVRDMYICRYMSYVECSLLHEYFLSFNPTCPASPNKDNKVIWNKLQETLPELTNV